MTSRMDFQDALILQYGGQYEHPMILYGDGKIHYDATRINGKLVTMPYSVDYSKPHIRRQLAEKIRLARANA